MLHVKFENHVCSVFERMKLFNPTALRKAKFAYNFSLSECNKVKKNLNASVSINCASIHISYEPREG